MAKAPQYLNEYETALADYNKSVESYNKSLDEYEASFFNGGLIYDENDAYYPGFDFGGGFFGTKIPEGGIVGRKPTSITFGEAITQSDEEGSFYATAFRDKNTGQVYPVTYRNTNMQVDENTVVTSSGLIMKFSSAPGNFTTTLPTFDQDRYRTLLTEDFQSEQAATVGAFQAEQRRIQEALQKSQAEERARFEQQRQEMEREQARFAAESAAAEEQARRNLEQAQSDAASAAKEREVKTKQLRDETETVERNVGARRAGYVRARRMRSRSLLSGL
jgi:hypothetical protein